VLRQSLPSTAASAAAGGHRILGLGSCLRSTLGLALGRLVAKQPELVGIDTLPPGTILAAEQLLDLMLKLLDPPLHLLDGSGLLADDLVAYQFSSRTAVWWDAARSSRLGLAGEFWMGTLNSAGPN
jgi:hypothetical protein